MQKLDHKGQSFSEASVKSTLSIKGMRSPELLSPAGNLEKLKTACRYGADAVYVGGTRFGLRSGADNLTLEELREGVGFARERDVRVFVTLNAFLHDQDLSGLEDYVLQLEKMGVSALIVSDLGVIRLIRRVSKLPLHLSTQASCLNVEAAKQWKSLGVTRIITGRECSIREAGQIKREADIEVEMFIHGAMCSAYSGHCTISNYTAGRDSNRGGCKQSCRFEYDLDDQKEPMSLMSSKDLNGFELLPEFIEENIDSLKIEGRMKSQLYIATTTKTYRMALDALQSNIESEVTKMTNESLFKIPNRGYTTASLKEIANRESITAHAYHTDWKFSYLGQVLSTDEQTLVQLRNPLKTGDEVELVQFSKDNQTLRLNKLQDFLGRDIENAHQNQIVGIPEIEGVAAGTILKKVFR